MFNAREISFTSADGTALAGELTVPTAWSGVLAVLQQGSVLCDRDGQTPRTNAPSTLYRRIARLLSDAGIASFRYDKREWNLPAPTPLTYSLRDRVADLCAAAVAAESAPEMAGATVALVGHSEGGLVAQSAAGQLSSVTGIAVLASPATTLLRSMEWRADQALNRGTTKLRGVGIAMHAVLHEVRRRVDAGDEFTTPEFEAFRDYYAQFGGLQGWESWPWLAEHARLDLPSVVRGLPARALYVHGDHDRIVDPASLEGYQQHWDAARKSGAEFRLLPNVGHYLEDSTRKAFVVSEPLVATVAEWLNALRA